MIPYPAEPPERGDEGILGKVRSHPVKVYCSPNFSSTFIDRVYDLYIQCSA